MNVKMMFFFVILVQYIRQLFYCNLYLPLDSIVRCCVLQVTQTLQRPRTINLFNTQPLHVDSDIILDNRVPFYFWLWYEHIIKFSETKTIQKQTFIVLCTIKKILSIFCFLFNVYNAIKYSVVSVQQSTVLSL